MSEKAIETKAAGFKRFVSKMYVARLAIIFLIIPCNVSAQDKIVIGYDGYAGFQGPIWAAKDLHFFEKFGLAPELVLIPGSARGMAALMSNSAQFVQGSVTGPLSVYLRGGDVVVVAAALNKFPFSMVTKKEIRTPSQLVGKRIGIVNFGGSNDLAVTLALQEWNIPRSAVTILASGGAPERLAALLSGVLDATVLSPPETVAASQAGLHILANLSELRASFPQTLIMVRRSYLANHRDTVKRFVSAYSEAIHKFKTDEETAIAVYARHLKQTDRKVLEETYKYYAPRFSFPPRIDPEGVNNALELVRRNGAKEMADVNLGSFIDKSVLDELEKEGFFKKLR